MQGKKTINTFNEGMTFDNDVLNSRASTYRYSMNGRVVFNKNGTHSWETENGSKTSFLIAARNGTDANKYVPIGGAGNNNISIIFSVDEANNSSEIGIVSIDEAGDGSYKTLFNDQDDINGDKLNLHAYNQIDSKFIIENPQLIRVYWVDGVASDSNQPRTLTFTYDETIGNASDVNAYAVGVNTSVHTMGSQAEFRMGLIKYVKNVGGNIPTGIYQYTYSLGTDAGYNTPWYPLTRRVFVCSDDVSSSDWTDYEMGGIGIVSSKGNQIQVKGVDERFDKIRVAYVYSVGVTTVNDSRVFIEVPIDSDEMSFDHVSNIGDPLLPEEVTDLFSGIVAAKTLNIKDATLYYGNIKENLIGTPDIESILSGLTVKPIFKDMRSDEKLNSISTNNTLPITNAAPRTGITQTKLHSAVGGLEDHVIDNDYVNYKGTQIDHLYPGYFRGETYRYALVLYDKLGFESFAYHLADLKFPNQSEATYNWDRIKTDGTLQTVSANLGQKAWPTNNFNLSALRDDKVLVGDVGNTTGSIADSGRQVSHIKIMGVEFGGIDLSSLQNSISGFKIVRVKRDKTILLQGLIMPCVTIVDNDDGSVIEPNPTLTQRIADFTQAGNIPVPLSNLADIEKPGGGDIPFETHHDPNTRYSLKSNVSVFYPPATDFGSATFPTLQTQDRMTLIGGCWDEDAWKAHASFRLYNKLYYSLNEWHNGPATGETAISTDPYPQYMSQIDGIEKVTYLGPDDKSEDWIGVQDLINSMHVEESGDDKRGFGKPGYFLKHGNFFPERNAPTNGVYAPFYSAATSTARTLNDGGQANNRAPNSYGAGGTFIANYTRPNPNPYGGLTLSALETSVFIGTGHFQPINNETFDAQGMPAGLVFDEVQVFGGDCFLDYMSFLRIYPRYLTDIDTEDKHAFSVGCVFPFEYEFNHTLREAAGASAPTYDHIGPKYFGLPSAFNDGLYYGVSQLVEQFDLNGILGFEEILLFFNPKPVNFLDNDSFPVRWRYTREKIYGDPVDNWRLFQVSDFRDLDGSFGAITSSLYLMNQIYSWQVGAFGRLRASDRALIESQQGGTLSTGVGDKLDGVDYVSTEYGNQHQWGLFKSDNAAYWIDVNKRKLMRFGRDGKNPLSDLKGVHQFLEYELPLFEDQDSPANGFGIHGVFDYGNNEALFTFVRDRSLTSPDAATDIVIRSRGGSGKAYVQGVVEHNQTARVFWDYTSQPNNGVVIPVGNQAIGVNENLIFYLKVDQRYVNVFSHKNGVNTLLFGAPAGTYYRMFRHSIDDDWMYEQVPANDATPEVCSLTYSEVGNYFSGFHSYEPSFYVGTKFLVLSNDSHSGYSDDNEFRTHDMGRKSEFPSFSNKSVLEVSVNEAQMLSKQFDSLRVNCNKDFSDKLDFFLMRTETQLEYIDMTSDTRKKYLEDILRFPLRTETQKDRIRGKHLLMTFELKNNLEHNDRITNLVTHYRPSNRM